MGPGVKFILAIKDSFLLGCFLDFHHFTCLYQIESSTISCFCQLSLFHTGYQSFISPKITFQKWNWKLNDKTSKLTKLLVGFWSLFCVY